MGNPMENMGIMVWGLDLIAPKSFNLARDTFCLKGDWLRAAIPLPGFLGFLRLRVQGLGFRS